MEKEIAFLITKESDTILWESVELSEDYSRLRIEVSYPEEFQYNSYLIIYDSEGNLRLQKLMGYGEQVLGIGESSKETSVGGVVGTVKQGTWKIALGIFTEYLERYEGELPATVTIKLSNTKEGKDLTEPMGENVWITDGKTFAVNQDLYDWDKIYNPDTRWYRGDFHTHTRLSDGKETVKNAIKKALRDDMDFYIPTEHNLLHTGWENTRLMAVPGIEVTTNIGHFNLFGLTKAPSFLFEIMKNMGSHTLEDIVLKQIQEAVQNQWIVSINHPFLHIWKWQGRKVKLKDIQCMEIINDPTYGYGKDANDKAIAFLDLLWEDGHKIYGIGGSDSHNLENEFYPGADHPSIPGDPSTFVYAEQLSPKHLLDNVRKGHICVTRFCKIQVTIQGDNRRYLPGEEIKESQIKVQGAVEQVVEEPKVYLVAYVEGNEKMVTPLPVTYTEEKWMFQTEIGLAENKWQWYRLEVRNQQGEFLGFVNPVYQGDPVQTYVTFGDALQKMESAYED